MKMFKNIGIIKLGATIPSFELKKNVFFIDNIGRKWYGRINKDVGIFIGYIKSHINDGYDVYYCKIYLSDYMYGTKFISQKGVRFLFNVRQEVVAEQISKNISDKLN